MAEFLMGVGIIIVVWVFASSYIPTNTNKKYGLSRRRVNAVTGNPAFEIISFITLLIVFINIGGFQVLMTLAGIGIGLSLANKASVVMFGKDKFWRK